MENQPTEPLNESSRTKDFKDQNLDDLLSLRGKPFSDWKEERLYLREKWGMQGRKVDVQESDKPSTEEDA
jgi:hypothetical protein